MGYAHNREVAVLFDEQTCGNNIVQRRRDLHDGVRIGGHLQHVDQPRMIDILHADDDLLHLKHLHDVPQFGDTPHHLRAVEHHFPQRKLVIEEADQIESQMIVQKEVDRKILPIFAGTDDKRIAVKHLVAGEPEVDVAEDHDPSAHQKRRREHGKIQHRKTAVEDPVRADKEGKQGQPEIGVEQGLENPDGLICHRDKHIHGVEAEVLEDQRGGPAEHAAGR